MLQTRSGRRGSFVARTAPRIANRFLRASSLLIAAARSPAHGATARGMSKRHGGTLFLDERTGRSQGRPQVGATMRNALRRAGHTSPSGIAIDEANVYWANTGSSMGSGSIAKVAIAGGSVVTIASGLSGPVSLAVDAQYVYWVNSADGSVMKAPK